MMEPTEYSAQTMKHKVTISITETNWNICCFFEIMFKFFLNEYYKMFTNKNLIVIAIYVYLVMYVLKDTTQKILASIVALYLLTNNIAGFTDGEESPESNVSGRTVSADGAKAGRKIDAPSLNTGPYDGLCLKTGNTDSWMKSPDETALVPNDRLYTYLSSQGPIKMRLSDQAALRGPPVDGVPGSAEKMFMWANNVTSPLCCPSNFSTSTGCVCSTKNQRDFIASRGMMDVDPNNDVSTDEVEV